MSKLANFLKSSGYGAVKVSDKAPKAVENFGKVTVIPEKTQELGKVIEAPSIKDVKEGKSKGLVDILKGYENYAVKPALKAISNAQSGKFSLKDIIDAPALTESIDSMSEGIVENALPDANPEVKAGLKTAIDMGADLTNFIPIGKFLKLKKLLGK